jgi:hypothetical protein
LEFDQNFEGANLDSAYLVNMYEYNLLMKVDTNTRGQTYWFMFKVQGGFRIGKTYKFNVLNFTRNLRKLYDYGMNVVTKVDDLVTQESEKKDNIDNEL